ncbi:MAG: dCTP deaminase [Halanaerobiales bacterium]|nr:dCTP deaminase [Halanaerobiales bacterium]
MSLLPDHKILEKIYDKEISISPFIREHIQPSSIDLTLFNKIRVPKKNITNPVHAYTKEYVNFFEHKDITEFVLQPNSFILAQVKEFIKLSKKYNGHIQNRNSLSYAGINVGISSYINPGYKGRLTIAINNFGSFPIVLTSGMRICQLVINEIKPVPKKGYKDRKDSKYHNKKEIVHTMLYKDNEFKEFESIHGVKKDINNKELADFFEKRIQANTINLDKEFTDEQRQKLGL